MSAKNELLGEGPSRRRPPPPRSQAVDSEDGSQQQQQIADLRAQQRAMLERAVRTSHESVEIGHGTTQSLGRQGEQLDRTNGKLDEVEYELKVSDKIVKNMSGLTGMVASWFWRTPKPPAAKDGDPTPAAAANNVSRLGESSSRGRPAKSQADAQPASSQTSTEHDEYLDELGANVRVMREQAQLHQRVMAEQNKKLDELAAKVDNTNAHMRQTERNIRKI